MTDEKPEGNTGDKTEECSDEEGVVDFVEHVTLREGDEKWGLARSPRQPLV